MKKKQGNYINQMQDVIIKENNKYLENFEWKKENQEDYPRKIMLYRS